MANFTFVENDTGPRLVRVTLGAEQTVQPFQFITRALQEIYYKKHADLENDAGPKPVRVASGAKKDDPTFRVY